MSRAFVKEDVDPPERSGKVRAASGLPPGALNYITARGAQRLRDSLGELRRAGENNVDKIEELERLLASVTIVETAGREPDSIAFGARVTVTDKNGEQTCYRVVGVDEVEFYSDAVTWISPTGKALLAADPGARLILEPTGPVTITKVEYPQD